MRQFSILPVFLLTLFIILALCYASFAAGEQKSFKDNSSGVDKTTVDYPANVVNGSVDTAGTAAKDAAHIVTDTLKVTGETLSGDIKKAPQIVITPVEEGLQTVEDAAVDTINTPFKAAETTAEEQ